MQEDNVVNFTVPPVRSRKELFEIMALPEMVIGVIPGQSGYWVKLAGTPFRKIKDSLIEALVEDQYLFWNGQGYDVAPGEAEAVREQLGYTQLLLPLMTPLKGGKSA